MDKKLEKLIYTQLSVFFFKFIPHSQKRKTDFKAINLQHTRLDVITVVYDQINVNEYTSMTLLDFKQDFDTVKHTILIKKLEHYGIRVVTLHPIYTSSLHALTNFGCNRLTIC